MSDTDRLIGLVETVAAALNAAQPAQPDPPAEPLPSPFVLPFTAARRVLPITDMTKVGDELLVTLIGIGLDEQRQGGLSQGVFTGDYEVDIVVQQRLASGDDVETFVPARLLLAEQIRDFLKQAGFAAGDAKGVLISVDGNPAYSMASLLEKRCFVGVQTVAFRVF